MPGKGAKIRVEDEGESVKGGLFLWQPDCTFYSTQGHETPFTILLRLVSAVSKNTPIRFTLKQVIGKLYSLHAYQHLNQEPLRRNADCQPFSALSSGAGENETDQKNSEKTTNSQKNQSANQNWRSWTVARGISTAERADRILANTLYHIISSIGATGPTFTKVRL